MKNANMPKGRGMVKWQPFASMPEQFACICDLDHNLATLAKLWFFLFVANLLFQKKTILSYVKNAPQLLEVSTIEVHFKI